MSFKNFWHPVLEKCGLILKDGTVIPVDNTHPYPETGFIIPEDVIQKHSMDIAILWHSHPSNNSNLSVEDYKSFLTYPEYIHRIYGYDEMTDYYVRNNVVYVRDQNET